MRGLFRDSSSSSSRSSKHGQQQSGDNNNAQSPSTTRRSFAFMKYSPGKRSSTSMRRIREHAGQIAQQLSTPESHHHHDPQQQDNHSSFPVQEAKRHGRTPQDMPTSSRVSPRYDHVSVNRIPLKPPAQNRKKVALDMFMEQQRPTSNGPASVASDASSRAPSVSGVAARRLARSKKHQEGVDWPSSMHNMDRTINSMPTFPSNSSMQRNFVQKHHHASSAASTGSTSSAAARRRARKQAKSETMSAVDDLYAELMNEDSPMRMKRLSSGSRRNSKHPVEESPTKQPAAQGDSSMEISNGFSFDAFGLDAEEVDSEVNAAIQDLAGSHPALTRIFGGEGFPGLEDSPAGSYSGSTPTLDVEGDSVDGFRSLPMNVSKPSPASSERSTLTGSSPTDGHDQGGRVNMFKQQAGFHTSKKSKPLFDSQDSGEGWESFEPSPTTPRYAISEPGAPSGFFANGWSGPLSARQAPALPNLFDDDGKESDDDPSKDDKGSDDDGFSQSSWQGDSDGELSPEVAKKLEAQKQQKQKDDSSSSAQDFGPTSLTEGFAMESGGEPSGDGFDFLNVGGDEQSDDFAFSNTPSSAAGFAPAGGLAFSDAGAPSSAGGVPPESDTGASSNMGAPSDVGVAMDFGSDVGVASDMGVNSDYIPAAVPEEIVGRKKSKSKKTTASHPDVAMDDVNKSMENTAVDLSSGALNVTADSLEASTGALDTSGLHVEDRFQPSDPADLPVQKVSSLAKKWERREKQHDVPAPSLQRSRSSHSSADDQISHEVPHESQPAHSSPAHNSFVGEPMSELEMRRQQLNESRGGEEIGPQILTKAKVEKTSEQQKRANECAAQRTSFESYKERLKPAHLRNGQSASAKSEIGAYSYAGNSEVNSLLNKLHRNQSQGSGASYLETRSETGASPDFLSSVKLRNTGGISRLMSKEESVSDSGNSRASPLEFDSEMPQETDVPIQQPEPKKMTYRERRELELKRQQEEAKECENQYAVEEPRPKLTYRQQRELELQQQRAEQAIKDAEEKAKNGEERDVASLIRRRVALNRRKSPEVEKTESKPVEDISSIRQRLKKVSVVKEHSSQGKPSPIAQEEETLTTENSYSSNSLERIDPAGARNGSNMARSNYQVPTHIDAPTSPDPVEKDYDPSDIYADSRDSQVLVTIDSDETPLQNSLRPASERGMHPSSNDEQESERPIPEPSSSDEDKESKRAFLTAFFGKRAGLPTASLEKNGRGTTGIVQGPAEEPTVSNKDPELQPARQPVNRAVASTVREDSEDRGRIGTKPEEKPKQPEMDIHAATAVLIQRNQQDQPAEETTLEEGRSGANQTDEDAAPDEGRGGADIVELQQSLMAKPASTATSSSSGVALKNDPKYEKYFRMLKFGMPMDVVKHAMTRDGIDASVMDGDHDKPAGGVPLKEDPKFEKYFKMLKMGLPMGAVKNAMQRDGLDPSIMDGDHDAPVGANGSAAGEQVEKKPKDTHRRTRLHWETLRKVRKNSVWSKINEDPELQQLCIDEDEFTSLFQAELTPSAFQKKKSPTPSSPTKRRGPSVRVIDPKRANNGGIVLARLKISQDDLADAVDKIDDTVMTAEQMQHIVEFLPTSEERKNLERYMLEGDQDAAEKFDMLCECEKFMVAMMTVKHAKRKVRALLFKLQFQSCLGSLEADASTVETACDELSNSVRLRKLLGIVLNIGNRLNTAGNGNKRKAGAFTLESLLKLSHAKAFDRKTTFLNYVVLIVQRNNELLLNFKDDIPTVLKAAKVYWDQCLTDLEEVESQLENSRRISLHMARLANPYRLKKKKNPSSSQDDEDSLSEVELSLQEEVESLRGTRVGQFTLFAIKKVSNLRQKVEVTNKKFGRLLEYFGEEDKRADMQPHELFTIMVDFCKDFDKSKEQVVANEKKKMREERKRQASGKNLVGSRTTVEGRGSLKVSNLQPNMSSVMKGMAPVSPSAKSDPGSSPAYRNKNQKVNAQRAQERRSDPPPMLPQGFNNPVSRVRESERASPPKKSVPSIPVDPYNVAQATQNSSLRQRARLRRQQQVANSRSYMTSSTTSMTERSETSHSPTSHHQGRPPLDQTLSPRSSIRQKRRMQQRNGVVGSRR